MLIPSEQCAEPPKGSRPHRVRPIPRRRVPRKARNESGTAEEKAFVSYYQRQRLFQLTVDSEQLTVGYNESCSVKSKNCQLSTVNCQLIPYSVIRKSIQ